MRVGKAKWRSHPSISWAFGSAGSPAALLLHRQVGRLPRQKSDSAQESRLVCTRWCVGFTGGWFRAAANFDEVHPFLFVCFFLPFFVFFLPKNLGGSPASQLRGAIELFVSMGWICPVADPGGGGGRGFNPLPAEVCFFIPVDLDPNPPPPEELRPRTPPPPRRIPRMLDPPLALIPVAPHQYWQSLGISTFLHPPPKKQIVPVPLYPR